MILVRRELSLEVVTCAFAPGLLKPYDIIASLSTALLRLPERGPASTSIVRSS